MNTRILHSPILLGVIDSSASFILPYWSAGLEWYIHCQLLISTANQVDARGIRNVLTAIRGVVHVNMERQVVKASSNKFGHCSCLNEY